MEPHLQVSPDQKVLTTAQRAEAERFVAEWVQRQTFSEPVNEAEAETYLAQAYAVAGLAAPRHVHWMDGPLELVAVLAQDDDRIVVAQRFKERAGQCAWEDGRRVASEISLLAGEVDRTVDGQVSSVWRQAEAAIKATYGARVVAGLLSEIFRLMYPYVWHSLTSQVGDSVWEAVGECTQWPVVPGMRELRGPTYEERLLWHGSRAYEEAAWLASLSFCDAYLAPNVAHAMARFNQMVSGYWLGQELALLVRRPRFLARDAQGRLHSANGVCIEYHNGWGFTAWHGVRVPERVVLAPEALTREDYLRAPDMDVRRVIQERMGERFVWEMDARFIDSGPQGVLYEVDLLDDRERVARYVQVRDTSTGREYFSRVPPTIQAAEEAVAWTFGPPARQYSPAQ